MAPKSPHQYTYKANAAGPARPTGTPAVARADPWSRNYATILNTLSEHHATQAVEPAEVVPPLSRRRRCSPPPPANHVPASPQPTAGPPERRGWMPQKGPSWRCRPAAPRPPVHEAFSARGVGNGDAAAGGLAAGKGGRGGHVDQGDTTPAGPWPRLPDAAGRPLNCSGRSAN